VAIGRALINNPALLLADEPTGNLDPEHSWDIMQLLANLNLRGTTVIVASHDMMVVERMDKRIVQLDHGRIVSDTHNNLEPAPLPGFFKEHQAEHNDYPDEDSNGQNPRASQQL
jgi:ABC-type multidrug transport system ATPase subunit